MEKDRHSFRIVPNTTVVFTLTGRVAPIPAPLWPKRLSSASFATGYAPSATGETAMATHSTHILFVADAQSPPRFGVARDYTVVLDACRSAKPLQTLPYLFDQVDCARCIDRTQLPSRTHHRLTHHWRGARPRMLLPTPIVIEACPGLMPAPPSRPLQERLCAAFDQQDQLPEQPSNFRTT
jgi:hypothetical protein